jgi:polyferredoxin
MLCGVMIFCLVGLLSRNHSDLQSIGRVFWWIYMVALSLGILLGLAYKPRAWCAVCPLGTLQDTIGEAATPARGIP